MKRSKAEKTLSVVRAKLPAAAGDTKVTLESLERLLSTALVYPDETLTVADLDEDGDPLGTSHTEVHVAVGHLCDLNSLVTEGLQFAVNGSGWVHTGLPAPAKE